MALKKQSFGVQQIMLLGNISQCFCKERRKIRALTHQYRQGQYQILTSRWCWSFRCATLRCVCVHEGACVTDRGRCVQTTCVCVLLHFVLRAMCAQECGHIFKHVEVSSCVCVCVIYMGFVFFFFFFNGDNKNINLPWNHFWRKCRAVPIGTQ